MLPFFESQVPLAMAQLETEQASSDRDHVLSLLEIPRDPVDEQLKLPLFICRHVVCSESTSWIGFLPPQIRNKAVHAYDPLPPTTAISMYDNEYFSGVPTRSRGAGAGPGGGQLGFLGEMIGRLNQVMEEHPDGWQDRIAGIWREMTGRRELAGVPQEQRDDMLQQVSLFLLATRVVSNSFFAATSNRRSRSAAGARARPRNARCFPWTRAGAGLSVTRE